jgi:hypothetical protein
MELFGELEHPAIVHVPTGSVGADEDNIVGRRAGGDKDRGRHVVAYDHAPIGGSRLHLNLDRWFGSGSSTVHIATMTDTYHEDNKNLILYAIHHPVISLTNTIEVVSRQLLATVGTRLVGKRADLLANPPTLLDGKLFQFLCGGWLNKNAISCHAASGP